MVADRSSANRRKMVMYFLIDGSNSMNDGDKIGALNRSMSAAIELAQDLDVKNTTVQIDVAILQFGIGANGMECRWLNGEPEPVDRFEWVDQTASGWTPMADALRMLNQSMSRSKFMDAASASMAPVVVVMSDGIPCTVGKTQQYDYEDTSSAVEQLKKNDWFKIAIKTAIAIGDDADKDLLATITGSPETVFDVHDESALERTIKFIVVRSSMINSTIVTKSGKDPGAQKRFIEDAEKEKEEQKNSTKHVSKGWKVTN